MFPVCEAYRSHRWIKTLISLGPRLVVQVLLLAVFLYFFGFPAFARFNEKGVIVVQTKKDREGVPIPAITLAVIDQIHNNTCFQNNTSIEDCIEENTLNSSEIFVSVILGFKVRKVINITEEVFREDFTSIWAGRYYTLNLSLTIGPHSDEDQVFIGLNKNSTYTIFVHDPHYFLFNENPIALPTIMRRFQTKNNEESSMVYRIDLTEIQKLNLPSSPCNDDAGFNYESCLRRSISEKVTSLMI